MLDFKATMHQIRFWLGLRSRPRWGSLQRPHAPGCIKWGLLLREGKWGRGNGREVKKKGGGEGEVVKGGRGRKGVKGGRGRERGNGRKGKGRKEGGREGKGEEGWFDIPLSNTFRGPWVKGDICRKTPLFHSSLQFKFHFPPVPSHIETRAIRPTFQHFDTNCPNL